MAITLFDNGAGYEILTVGSNIATSTDCCCTGLEQWRYCPDDTTAAKLDFTHTDVDYAWLCLSSTWAKCYNDGGTTGTADNPTVLKQCGTTASTCSDLFGWHASDNFGGIGCNTGAIGDDNWGVRWVQQWTEGTPSIVSDSLRLTVDSGNPKILGYSNNGEASGGFTSTVKFTMATYLSDTSVSQSANLRVHTSAGAFIGQILINKNLADNNNQWEIAVDSGGSVTTTYSSDTIWFKMVRANGSSTISIYYSSNGTTYTDTGYTFTSSATVSIYFLAFSRWTAGNLVVDVDDFTFVDGSSVDINIDPTGTSCT